MRTVKVFEEAWPLHTPFVIARGSGLTEALALATEARAQGFRLMLGCMLCTSRAISAALPLVPQVSFADLDGPTWLAVDVEPALQFTTGELHL